MNKQISSLELINIGALTLFDKHFIELNEEQESFVMNALEHTIKIHKGETVNQNVLEHYLVEYKIANINQYCEVMESD
jgi:hypothetical protein